MQPQALKRDRGGNFSPPDNIQHKNRQNSSKSQEKERRVTGSEQVGGKEGLLGIGNIVSLIWWKCIELYLDDLGTLLQVCNSSPKGLLKKEKELTCAHKADGICRQMITCNSRQTPKLWNWGRMTGEISWFVGGGGVYIHQQVVLRIRILGSAWADQNSQGPESESECVHTTAPQWPLMPEFLSKRAENSGFCPTLLRDPFLSWS